MTAVAAGPASKPAARPAPDEGIRQDSPVGGQEASKIVFMCDPAGLPAADTEVLKDQLRRVVSKLKPVQSFNIVIPGERKPLVFSDAGLIDGTKENKQKADRFIDSIKPATKTDPLAAIQLGLGQKEQLLYVLSHKGFPDNAAAPKKVAAMNKASKVKINTILFNGDKDSKAVEDALQQIARDAGGMFVSVGSEDLKDPDDAKPVKAADGKPVKGK